MTKALQLNVLHLKETTMSSSSRLRSHCFAAALLLLLGLQTPGLGQDWPQWNGPNRDGVLAGTAPWKAIPKEGLKLLWQNPIGMGYSGPVSAQGRVVVTDYQKKSGEITNNPGTRDRLLGQERIVCFDGVSGKEIWVHAYDRPYALSYPGGPRATPVIAGGMVYSLGAEGDLVCLELESGSVQWKRQLATDYKTKAPIWGHAAVPLVIDDKLICLAGGEGSLVVALDRKTGKEIWRSLSGDEIGYCPPALIEHDGVRQLMIWDPEWVSSLDPNNGKVNWQLPMKPDYGMAVAPPVLLGDLLFVSGEGVSSMFQLSSKPMSAKPLWAGTKKTSLGLSNTVAVFDDGYLYGADYQSGALVCVDAKDGTRKWQSALPTVGVDRTRGGSNGAAYLIKANGFYYILGENGDVVSAVLSPKGYQETGRFHAIDPTNTSNGRDILWTFPAIADGHLLVRNDREIRCFELPQ